MTVNDSELVETKKHSKMLLAGLILGMLFGALDQTIVSTAMPTIIGKLGGLELMAWVTTAYMLTSTTIVPIAGKLSDIYGRKVIYIVGLVIFILGSALCGTAGSMVQLIWYRGLQGIGGGIMMPMAMIIIGDMYSGAERAKMQGVFGAVFGLSSVVGPQLGGWIVDHMAWEWVFFINLPVGILATIFIALGMVNYIHNEKAKIDFLGAITLTVGVVSLLLALTWGGVKYPWSSWEILSLFGVFFLFLVIFIVIEGKVEEPIIPLDLFKNRVFTIISIIGFLMAVGMFGAIMFMPLFMQGVIGVTATQAGTVMTPLSLAMVASSIISGRFIVKVGPKVILAIGLSIMTIGFMLSSTMGLESTRLIATMYMIITGLGMGMIFPVLTIVLQEEFPIERRGVVTAASTFFRSIGGTFGVALLGTVLNNYAAKILKSDLVPVLQKLPAQAQGAVKPMLNLIETNPLRIFQMILSPEFINKFPAILKNTIVPIIKAALSSSITHVFLVGALITAAGIIFTPFMGKVKISDTKEKKAPQPHI